MFSADMGMLKLNRDLLATNRDMIAAERDMSATDRDMLAAERGMLAADRDMLAADKHMLIADMYMSAVKRGVRKSSFYSDGGVSSHPIAGQQPSVCVIQSRACGPPHALA